MSLEPEYTFVPMAPPDSEWVMANGIIPDQLSAWPAKLFREVEAADGAMADMSLSDQVILVFSKMAPDVHGGGEMVKHDAALVIPSKVARELARMILKMNGGDGT